jgi:DNA-binding MarR family transcriptional regulator
MTRTLREEIKQTRPFSGPEQEALLSLERTAAVLVHQMAQEFEGYGVTPTQYNVLRILRGAGPAGLCRYEIRDRLVAQVPDVTRLLDRLEDAGLVERQRDTADRRQVKTRITKDGLALLTRMDGPVDVMQKRMLGHLGERKLRTLIELLQEVREAEGA